MGCGFESHQGHWWCQERHLTTIAPWLKRQISPKTQDPLRKKPNPGFLTWYGDFNRTWVMPFCLKYKLKVSIQHTQAIQMRNKKTWRALTYLCWVWRIVLIQSFRIRLFQLCQRTLMMIYQWSLWLSTLGLFTKETAVVNRFLSLRMMVWYLLKCLYHTFYTY